MNWYTTKAPRGASQDSNTPNWWWQIFDPAGDCISLVKDEKHADIICSMLNHRRDARARLDLGETL